MEPGERCFWNGLSSRWATDHLEYLAEWKPEFLRTMFQKGTLRSYLEQKMQQASDLLTKMKDAPQDQFEEVLYSNIIAPEVSEHLLDNPPNPLPEAEWRKIHEWQLNL
jgi:hypothetical protein